MWSLRGPRQVSKGPQDNDRKLGGYNNFWVGHQNLTAWIKHFKFKTESKVTEKPELISAAAWPLDCSELLGFAHYNLICKSTVWKSSNCFISKSFYDGWGPQINQAPRGGGGGPWAKNGWETLDWINVAKCRGEWHPLVNTVVNLWDCKMWGISWLTKEL